MLGMTIIPQYILKDVHTHLQEANLQYLCTFLKVVDTHLQVVYDLGSNNQIVPLNYVNVSDGLWHNVSVVRYDNQVILKLDHGDGKYFNQSMPSSQHQLIYVSGYRQVFGGANAYYKTFHNTPTLSKLLVASTCIVNDKDVSIMPYC